MHIEEDIFANYKNKAVTTDDQNEIYKFLYLFQKQKYYRLIMCYMYFKYIF